MIAKETQGLLNFIKSTQDKSNRLLSLKSEVEDTYANGTNQQSNINDSGDGNIVLKNSAQMYEVYADQIDQDIHQLQYKLDHIRRLIQGAGSDISAVVPRIWITDSGSEALRRSLEDLMAGAITVKAILSQEVLSKHKLKEVHQVGKRFKSYQLQILLTLFFCMYYRV